MNSKIKYVIGTGALLDYTVDAWREVEPDTDLRPLQLEQNASYQFDLSMLDNLVAENVTAFVIFDAQFLNFRRYELMGELKARGFKMPPLICKGACVATSAKVGENTLISKGAIIDHHCQIGYNTVIGAGANIGNGALIGHCVWTAAGVVIGKQVKINANVTLGYGVIISDHIEIGKLSVVDKPGKLSRNLPAKTFIYETFDEVITIVDMHPAATNGSP